MQPDPLTVKVFSIDERMNEAETRLTKIETTLPFLATKTDVEKLGMQIAADRKWQFAIFVVIALDIFSRWMGFIK